jgi:hypothetical protein
VGIVRRFWVEIVASAAAALVMIAILTKLPIPRSAPPATAASPLGALDGLGRYSIDTATIGRRTIVLHWHPQPKLAPARGESIAFSGWAVDPVTRAPASAVVAVVDGGPSYTAVTGIRRSDVAAALGASAYAPSGFAVTIPGCRLGPGRHTIAFRFVASDGRGYYRSGDFVDLDVQPSPAVRAPAVAYAVDTLEPALANPGGHRMTGWLVDAGRCRAAAGMRVTVDEYPVATARYGLSRPDVAAAYGVPAYAASGFLAVWNDAGLARGQHTLRMSARLSTGLDVDAGYVMRFVRR